MKQWEMGGGISSFLLPSFLLFFAAERVQRERERERSNYVRAWGGANDD